MAEFYLLNRIANENFTKNQFFQAETQQQIVSQTLEKSKAEDSVYFNIAFITAGLFYHLLIAGTNDTAKSLNTALIIFTALYFPFLMITYVINYSESGLKTIVFEPTTLHDKLVAEINNSGDTAEKLLQPSTPSL